VAEIEDRLYGKVLFGTTPFLQEKAPGRTKWLGRPLGYDNEDVYKKLLNFGREDLAKLEKQGAI
jgi:crotonobetainyl-CoA:carnitine CoA-transferase CaiB-like acyl-CoA transferase